MHGRDSSHRRRAGNYLQDNHLGPEGWGPTLFQSRLAEFDKGEQDAADPEEVHSLKVSFPFPYVTVLWLLLLPPLHPRLLEFLACSDASLRLPS